MSEAAINGAAAMGIDEMQGFPDAMAEALAMLPRNEAYVLRRLFGLDNGARATLADVAGELLVAPSRISQIRNEGLARLRYDRSFGHLQEYMPEVLGGPAL